jgi:gliding motility-associated-like protein
LKNLLSFVFALFFTCAAAQMDTEHWFAPMAGSPGADGLLQPESYLYLSTSETTPFPVEVYSGNVLYTTVQVSKGSPQIIYIPYNFMMTISSSEMFTAVPMGLHVKGTKKFFANYRFSVPNHAEIITSKGLAGVGKNFFAVMAPLTTSKDYLNATIGIIATEDDTSVTLSGYDPSVVFSDGISSSTRTFTLKKGQSYIINAVSDRDPANRTGLVGAKIEATQPIAVTNGNFNAIYTNENLSNNDILMDQSVPVDRLGNQFILVKGNGPYNNNMESALVVASEDDTHIIINGTDTGIVLNEGDYHIFGANNYIDQSRNHYNMSISTTKNVYVYQLLAGVGRGSVYATGGFNFIPALSCFLPNKIDEIASINEIGYDVYNAKLNIISEKGATVKVNGNVLSSLEGPFSVQGNPNWETYTVLNVSGNITVNSTKSVTAGIASGNGAVGYGGYFAGFSSVPVISKTGDCYAGVLLQVDDSYDQYQWYLNGKPIPNETHFFINPDLYGSGNYTANITKTNCETKLTAPYQFTKCPPISTTTFNIGSCQTVTVTPAFTSSSQQVNPLKTKIIVRPSYGNATVDATTGKITYTPNATLTSNVSDVFVYYIEGNAIPEDSEYFKVIVNVKTPQAADTTLTVCPNTDGTGTFNLSLATVSSDATNTVAYYSDQLLTNRISNFTNYKTPPGTVYAAVTSTYNCAKTVKIFLELTQLPILNGNNYNFTFCDDNFAGSIPIKFSTIAPQIISNYTSSFIVRYYLNPTSQQNGTNDFLPDDWSYSANTTVYVRAFDTAGCTVVLGQINFIVGAKTPLKNSSVVSAVCDDKLVGKVNVDLNNYLSEFTANTSATFYANETDAKNKQSPVSANQNLTASKTFYIRFESNNACPNIGTLTLNISTPKKSTTLRTEKICPNSTVNLDAGPGFESYKWSTGETSSKINVPVGTYYVDLGFNGCVYRQTVEVTAAELPQIKRIEVTGNTATVSVAGGTPPYQYSIDNINFQSSNILTNIPRGKQTVYVKDAQNCKTVTKEFLILNLINVITPNDDGKNDVLDYSDLSFKKEVQIEIFDRHGNLVFFANKAPYFWDGRMNGRPLATGSFWYILKWIEPDTDLPVLHKGWILVKNRD